MYLIWVIGKVKPVMRKQIFLKFISDDDLVAYKIGFDSTFAI